jgi:outer membrane protein insertion porin family
VASEIVYRKTFFEDSNPLAGIRSQQISRRVQVLSRRAVSVLWWSFALILLQASTHGQASYQGQIVSSIGVIADPRLNTDKLRPLISQAIGQPYSQPRIDSSVGDLKKAGNFTKVRVDVEPETAGLRVNFILEPAYYIGVLTFPGADAFRYTRLLQVINFQDEQAYDKSQIPGQENLLLDFFRSNGFFAATVRSDVELDDAHQIASPVFRVALGKRARIGAVNIHGTPPDETNRLLHSVQGLRSRLTGGLLKPGKAYTPSRIKSATTLLKAYLVKQHYLANRLTFDPPQYHADTNRADISMTITIGPVVNIKTTGAKLSFIPYLSNREIKKLVPIYSEGSVDSDLVDEGERNLGNYFQKKGYFDVKVTTVFQHDAGKITISYSIDKGRKHKVDHIIFTGNHQLSSADLLADVEIRKHSLLSRGMFSQKLLNASVKNIQALYRNTGYEDVKVTPTVVDHEPKIDVTFKIDEGTRTLVDHVEITGNRRLSLANLRPAAGFTVLTGTPFSPGAVSKDRSQILAQYLDLGYLNADVKTPVTRHPDNAHRVDIAFVISEHQQILVKDVVLIGQQVTRPRLMNRTAAISAGAPLSQDKLLEAQSELYNLGIFDWASVGPKKEIADQTGEEAVVKVHEAKRNSITYGIGFEATRRGGSVPAGTVAIPGLPTIGTGNNNIVPSQATFVSPRGSIEYTRRNFRGLGETGEISILAARLDQRALASYTDPHFRNTQWNALTSFSLERTTENPLFAARLGDAAFQLERTLDQAKSLRLQVRYDFNKTRLSALLVPQLVLEQDRNVRLSTLSATLIKDTRDKPLDAHRGIYGTINLGVTPTALGSSANFAKLYGQYAYYRPLKGMVWANSIRLGFAKPLAGSFVPTSQLFFTGGGDTIRGFPLNGAGPQRLVPFCAPGTAPSACTSEITVPVGGEQLFIVNSELRFPLHLPMDILKPLGAVVFYDGGNVYSRINFNQFIDNYTNTVGVGLRYATPIGPVRIDLGRNLNPVPGLSSTQYFITLGQSF